MWTGSEIKEVREALKMDIGTFARLLGVDVRTAARWEAGGVTPTGAADAVLTGLREKLKKDPKNTEQVVQFVVGAAAVGGLAYLLVKLFDQLTEGSKK